MKITIENFTPSSESFKDIFIKVFNEKISDFDVTDIRLDEVYVVWFAYILGNAKCLISTTRPDHRYFELTYDASANSIYFDIYVKVQNIQIDLE